jgi:hypothetical protein
MHCYSYPRDRVLYMERTGGARSCLIKRAGEGHQAQGIRETFQRADQEEQKTEEESKMSVSDDENVAPANPNLPEQEHQTSPRYQDGVRPCSWIERSVRRDEHLQCQQLRPQGDVA